MSFGGGASKKYLDSLPKGLSQSEDDKTLDMFKFLLINQKMVDQNSCSGFFICGRRLTN